LYRAGRPGETEMDFVSVERKLGQRVKMRDGIGVNNGVINAVVAVAVSGDACERFRDTPRSMHVLRTLLTPS
jgi:hypothetical protein